MKRPLFTPWLAPMLVCAAAFAGLSLMDAPAHAQAAALNFQDSAQSRAFEVAADEVEIFQSNETKAGRLKQILENRVTGGSVVEDQTTRVVLKVVGGYDPARVVAGTDEFRKALPGSDVSPVLYVQGQPRNQWSRRIATRDILIFLKEGETAAQLAQQFNASEIIATPLANVARLKYQTPFHALDAAKAIAAGGHKVQPLFKRQLQRQAANLPNDQFFPDQWHLVNTGQLGGTARTDINVLPVWNFNKGLGVIVGVVDDGLEVTHPDLRDNCPPVSSLKHHDFNDADDNPTPIVANGDAHGTSVGGLIAARQNNGQPDPITGKLLGVSGVSPESTLYGLRLIAGPSTDADAGNAFTWAPGGVSMDVCNNSWGYTGSGLKGLDILGQAGLRDAATKGRNGRGQATVFSAGNGRFQLADANHSTTSNSRYVICVGALNAVGTFSSYSTPGAPLLIAAPGGGLGSFGDELRCTTTDVTGVGGYNPSPGNLPNTDYTNTFNGTSTAAPVVSGVVALMLKANPQLGWRDVKEILASTARRVDFLNPDWVMRPALMPLNNPDRQFNAAGFKFNHDYGAGMVDAFSAVARSIGWKNLTSEIVQRVSVQEPLSGTAIPANGAALTRNFNFAGPNLRVEQIEVEFNATHLSQAEVEITLTSPSGVTSFLHRPYFFGSSPDFKNIVVDDSGQRVARDGGWVFTTTHNWGENSQGTWTLSVRDALNNSQNGRIEFSEVRLYGTAAGQQRVIIDQQRSTAIEPVSGPITHPFTIRRLGTPTGSFTVSYQTVNSSATAGADFNNLTGSITFLDGETTKQIDLTILNDNESEDLELVNIALFDLQGADVAFGGTTLATVEIVDSTSTSVSIVATDSTASETTVETLADLGEFTITRSKVTSTPLDVYYTLSGTATEGTQPGGDYQPLPTVGLVKVATIPAFESSVKVVITPKDDLDIEGTESVIATLQLNGLEYIFGIPQTATIQLVDNDRPSVQILPDDNLAVEEVVPTNLATFTVRRIPATDLPLQVFLNYGGTQILGTNYKLSYVDSLGQTIELTDPLIGNSVEIAPNQESVTVTLTPIDDTIYQATKTVDISLQVSTLYDFSLGFLTSTRINIVENDPFPDTKVPTIVLSSPKNGTRFMIADQVTFSGSASDTASAGHTPSVEKVLYRINRGDWTFVPGIAPGASVSWSNVVIPLVGDPAGPAGDLLAGFNTLDVQAFDSDGNPSKVVSSIFKRVQQRNLVTAVNGSGTVSGGKAIYEVGDTVKLTATPASGNIFGGWTGTLPSTSRIYTFTMPDSDVNLTANFAPNPFVAETAGNYAGLVQGAQFNYETSGYITVTIGNSGLATCKLTISGVTYPFKGEFLSDGTMTALVKRKNTTPLTVTLTADLNPAGTRRITGTVTSASFTAPVIADRAHYNAKTNPAPDTVKKTFTVVMPPADPIGNPEQDPRGFGIGKVKIGADGVARFTGILPDGTKASFNQALSKDNTWPLFLNPYKKKGVLLGVNIIDTAQMTSDMNGTFDWYKPFLPKDLFFPLGFKIQDGKFLGSIYDSTITPPLGGFVAGANNAKLLLEEGSLLSSISKTLTWDLSTLKVAVSQPGDDKLAVQILPKTGDLKGTFYHPVSDKRVTITGILFQKTNVGYAFFPGSSVPGVNPQSGRVTFSKP